MVENYFLAQFSAIGKMFCLLYKMTVICTFQQNEKQIKHLFTAKREREKFPDNYRKVADGREERRAEAEV